MVLTCLAMAQIMLSALVIADCVAFMPASPSARDPVLQVRSILPYLHPHAHSLHHRTFWSLRGQAVCSSTKEVVSAVVCLGNV